MREEVRRFGAVTADGTQYTVVEWQRYTGRQPLAGAKSRAAGSIYLTLASGESVNQLDDRTYQIVQTDEIIRVE